jgi:predicted metal-dependent phosphoesterase TrpH
MIPAAMHLHSTWSDGEFSLAELRGQCLADGFRVAFMADHADAFQPGGLEAYVADCAARSSREFLFVPGIEFACRDRMHIVGYGVTTACESDSPEEVIAHIRECRGIAVIAHPKPDHFERIAAFRTLPHGIEAWNTKYDGRAAPRPATFELIQRMRARGHVLAFYGIDLHWRHQFRGMVTHIDAESERNALLEALARGAFRATCRGIEFLPTGALDPALARRFRRRHERSHALRRLLRASKRVADRLGLPTPAALKAQLRRLF